MWTNKIVLTAGLLAGLLSAGCVKSHTVQRPPPFEAEELDAVLAISIDLSGSFSGLFSEQAFALLQDITQRFFTTGMGGNTRVVLSQMSGDDRVVLFEGSAGELRSRFKSPEELKQFLLEHSSPNGSPIYDATRQTVDYVNQLHGVGPNTRLLTVLVSDLRESEQDRATRSTDGHRMLKSLKQYQENGGSLACYCVHRSETARWQRIFEMAGFEPGHTIIQNELVARPQLPNFD